MRRIFRLKEWIAIFISVASSVFFFKTEQFFKVKESSWAIFPALLNILVLLVGLIAFSIFNNDYYLIKRKHGEYDEKGLNDLKAIGAVLKIPETQTRYFVERTSAIIGQLVKNFSLFLWPLIIFYVINIIKDQLQLRVEPEFAKVYSFSEYVKIRGSEFGERAFWYLALSALSNIFNFVSGIGLWVCFSILYQKTLDADNKSTLHFGIYYFLLITYIVSYFVLIGTDLHILQIQYTIFALDLFCSIFNCVAMILFFNRLVQVLYFYQTSLRKKLLDKFYFFIATILFPLYACFQLFFALFDQLPPGNPFYSKVKGVVFFVCFLGKLFLILFLFSFIRIKWLHAAILPLLVYEDIPIKLAENVKGISDSIDSIDDDMPPVQSMY